MRKTFWCWVLVGLFTVITKGIMTGMGIRDGDWGVSLAGLMVCSICLVVQTYIIVKITEKETRAATYQEMWEWLRERNTQKSESQESACESSGPEEGQEGSCKGSDPLP